MSSRIALSRLIIVGVAIATCFALLSQGITREVPYGGMSGTVRMKENGKLLPNARVLLRPDIDWSLYDESKVKPEERLRSYATETDEDGFFRLSNVRAGKYLLEVYGDVHRVQDIPIEVAEGKPTSEDVELEPSDPYLEVYASQHVFTPGEGVEFNLHGFTKTEDSNIKVYSLPFAKVLASNGLRTLLQSFRNRWNNTGIEPSKAGKLVSELKKANSGRDIEGVFRMPVKFGELNEGLYWVECSAEKMQRGTWFVVSKIGLITKLAQGQQQCFVADLKSGKPISGATISTGKGEAAIERGKTNADGMYAYAVTKGAQSTEVTIAQSGKSWAVADNYIQSEDGAGQVTTFLYSDRPVYRPGDTVEFKGIARRLNGKDYEVVASTPVDVTVRDEDNNILTKYTTTTNDMGSFSGKFSTNKEMAPGSYYVETSISGRTSSMDVTLAAYRKPTYQIKVTPEKELYTYGDKIRMVVQVEYYFGGPVVGAEVDASISRATTWSYLGESGEEDDDYYDDYSEEYDGGYSYGGEYFTDAKAVTDENGRAIIEFDSKSEEDEKRPPSEYDFEYNMIASVSDAGGKYFEGNGSVKVTRGAFNLWATTDSYVVKKGDAVSYEIKATDNLTGKPIAGQEITAKFGYTYWDRHDSGFRQQAYQKITTDAAGKAVVQFTPKTSGSYELHIEGTDQAGNIVQSTDWIWVTGGDYSVDSYQPTEDLYLKLDKKQYSPGQTAKALIRTNKTGVAALLTIEGDELYESKVVYLDKPVVTVDIPVLQRHSPNVYVSVCFIRDKKFYSRTRRLAVDLGVNKLDIQVSTDKPSYLPGETVNYTIQTKTTDGKPVPADVSLGVVDESVYAIASDRTNIVSSFYPKRYNDVSTSYSFPEVYLDGGDKAPSSIQIRRKFRDTAAWAPFVRTKADGLAKVAIKLPDNLTSWRATAVGITAKTAVGQTTQNVLARKPLMVRLEAPAFWVQSDQQRLVAAVTNDSGKDADVNLDIQAEGAKLSGELKQKQFIRAGETRAFEWEVEVPTSGEAKFVARTWIDSSINDGVELKVPILPHAREFVDYAAGALGVDTKTTFVLKQGYDPNMGGLTVALSPSLGSTVYQSLEYLADFPYGCVEQTLSRFVPSLVAASISRSKGQQLPARFEKVDEWVAEGMSRIQRFQHSDGGWGWWEFDESSPYLTSMVLEAMDTAHKGGYSVNDNMLKRGVEWATKYLSSPMPKVEKDKKGNITNQYLIDSERRERLYLCYALSLHGVDKPVADFLAQYSISTLNSVDAANVALAYHTLGSGYEGKTTQAYERMMQQGNETPSILTWKEDYWGRETTGRALFAMTAIRPDDPRTSKVVVGLMLARRNNYWYSTRDTNFILMGMMNVWKKQQEEMPNMDVTVLVNGRDVGKLHIDQKFWMTPIQSLKVPPSALQQGENTVQLKPSGPGTCYYTASLKQYVYQKELGQLSMDKGFTVTRNYYRIVPQKMEDGSYELVPDKNPIDTLNRGDLVYCVVTVKTDDYREYLIVEDPLPSNCIVTDREVAEDSEEWYRYAWYDKLVIRDDKIAFFERYVMPGEHKFTYTLRAETPGKANVLPTIAYNMYDTEKFASSAENRLEVRR